MEKLSELMKQVIVFFIFILVMTTQSYGVTMKVGVKSLIGPSNIVRENVDDFQYELGYGIGFSSSLHFSTQFGLEMNLLVTNHSSRTDKGNSLSVSYFSVPFLVMVDPFELGAYFIGGFQINMVTKGLLYHPSGFSVDVSNQLNDFSYDVILGIGYKIDFLSFELRYELGVSDVLKQNSFISSVKETNDSFFFVVGANFEL